MRALSLQTAVLLSLSIFLSACSNAFGVDTEVFAHGHEQLWIIDSIGKDVTQIVLFAAKSNSKNKSDSPSITDLSKIDFQTMEAPEDPQKLSFHLKLNKDAKEVEARDFALKEYVWSATNFAPWVKQLIESKNLHASPPDHGNDAAFISSLANFTTEGIAHENDRISLALTTSPLDASLHDQAALLSSLFALRESASCFDDPRPALNRVSAHLIMSRALTEHPPESLTARLAEITLLTLAGRNADAVSKIDSFAADSPKDAVLDESSKSWLRALKIRATTDYRIADLKKATLLERLQYGRAIADDIGSDYLTEYLEKSKPGGSKIDWIRIGARGVSTVESGHLYSEPGVAAELQSFKDDLKLYKNKTLSSLNELSGELSEQPTGCLTSGDQSRLQVISWGDVSAFDARHLLDSFFQKYYFEKMMWSVPEQAKATGEMAHQMCSQVTLYPLFDVSRIWLERQRVDSDYNKSIKLLMLTEPQMINSTLWHRCIKISKNPSDLPTVYSWFVPRLLFGTTYDFYHRKFEGDPTMSLDDLKALKALNPYELNICMSLLWAQHPDGKFSSSQITESLGSLADHDVVAMQEIINASKSEPAKYAEQLEQISKFQPDRYFVLGQFYVERNQPEKAKLAYEKGIELGKDNVIKANYCNWLVNYYFDHGQKKQATQLATFAAQVYSNTGLKTMARLCERIGNLADAEMYFQQQAERYSEKSALMAFYQRNATKDAKYKKIADEYLKPLFPNGFVNVQASALHGAPKSGVKITSGSEITEKYSINAGDVIVAVNNVTTGGERQYSFMLEASPTTAIKFIVWNGHDYRLVDTLLTNRRLSCGIEDYSGN